jgi:hypothetical protein
MRVFRAYISYCGEYLALMYGLGKEFMISALLIFCQATSVFASPIAVYHILR